MNDILEGLQILIKYCPNGDIAAEHDIIYAGDNVEEISLKISSEEQAKLDSLGWFVDNELDCWCHYC